VVEEEAYRSSHLFGIRLPKDFNSLKLTEELQKRKIMVSLRGNSVRVSPHVYNTEHDIAALMAALSDLLP
jgi:selenocysteine lyase/cysteine desulfurase